MYSFPQKYTFIIKALRLSYFMASNFFFRKKNKTHKNNHLIGLEKKAKHKLLHILPTKIFKNIVAACSAIVLKHMLRIIIKKSA